MMLQKRNLQNALFLLSCLGVVYTTAVTDTKNFVALPVESHAQEDNQINSESCHQTKQKREVSFSTSQSIDAPNNRDSHQGRIPTRVRIGIPKVKVTQNEVRGVIGSNITLECFIESFPKSTNFWTKGELERLNSKDNVGKYVITEDNFRHVEFADRFRLQILDVDEQDLRIKFRCIASNEYGTDSGLIQVSAPSYLETTQFPENGMIWAHLGARVVLECEVKGYPLAVTYWFRKSTGEQLMWSDDYHVTEHKIGPLHYVSQLHIRSIAKTDFTTFICVSKNSFREFENTFRIMEKRPSWVEMSTSDANCLYPTGMWQWLSLLFTVCYCLQG